MYIQAKRPHAVGQRPLGHHVLHLPVLDPLMPLETLQKLSLEAEPTDMKRAANSDLDRERARQAVSDTTGIPPVWEPSMDLKQFFRDQGFPFDATYLYITSAALRTRRDAENLLKKQEEESGQKMTGGNLVKFWVEAYAQDRKRRSEIQKKGMDKMESNLVYDKFRPSTPPRRERKKDPNTGSDVLPYQLVDVEPRTELNDAEYANFRRGYEVQIVRMENRRRSLLQKESQKRPMTDVAMHSKKVDALKPGNEWKEKLDFENHLDYYHEVIPSDLYVLRVDVDANYPTDEDVDVVSMFGSDSDNESDLDFNDLLRKGAEMEDQREREKQEVRERRAAMNSVDNDSDNDSNSDFDDMLREGAEMEKQRERQMQEERDRLQDEERQQQQREERRQDARRQVLINENRGMPMMGDTLNDSHKVVPLPDKRADSLYASISILRTLRGNSVPLLNDGMIGAEALPMEDRLRLIAVNWMNDSSAKDDSTTRQHQLFIGSATSQFVNFLQSKKLKALDQVYGPKLHDYMYGMPRAKLQLELYRRQLPLKLGEFTSWSTNPYMKALGEPDSLMSQFCNSQAKQNAWPTLYEVEALAWALPEQADIHLYFNDNEWQNDDNGKGSYVQDWNKNPNVIKLGPNALVTQPRATAPPDPYRLLWSADHHMKFRPLVFTNGNESTPEYDKAVDLAKKLIDPRRDDTVGLGGLTLSYYRYSTWNGNHNL